MNDGNLEKTSDLKPKVAIALALSAVLLASVLLQTEAFSNTEIGEELFKDLCDSFFTVGILFVFSGALTMAAKNGTFNFFTYNGRILLSFFLPSRKEDTRSPYHEYVHSKEKARKKWRVGHIFIIGGVYCAVGAVFLALYSYYPY